MGFYLGELYFVGKCFTFTLLLENQSFSYSCASSIFLFWNENRGLYAVHLSRWLHDFKGNGGSINERFLIMDSEDIQPDENSVVHLDTVTDFIGVHRWNFTQPKAVHSFENRKKKMKDETVIMLQKFFQPFNDLLPIILNDSSWKDKWNYEL